MQTKSAFTLRSGRHRLGREVLGADGLDRVVAAPVDREAPQRPGHVIGQRIYLRRRPGPA